MYSSVEWKALSFKYLFTFDTTHFFLELTKQYIRAIYEDFYAIIVCSVMVYCKGGALLQPFF